jgi:hypothetical protein
MMESRGRTGEQAKEPDMTTPQYPPPPPQYQPPQYQPPQPPYQQQGPPPAPPAPPTAAPAKPFAAILATVAAVAAVVSSFLPLSVMKQTLTSQAGATPVVTNQTVTLWSRTIDPAPTGESADFYNKSHVALYGIPFALLAVILLAGAVLGLLSRRSPGSGAGAAARSALLVGAGGLVAAVLMLGTDLLATLSYEQLDPVFQQEYSTGIGFWVALGAGVLALVVLVLTLLPTRSASPATGPLQPPAQFAQPQQYVTQLPPQQQAPPFQQPYGPPSQPFPAQPPPQQYQQHQPPLFPPE